MVKKKKVGAYLGEGITGGLWKGAIAPIDSCIHVWMMPL